MRQLFVEFPVYLSEVMPNYREQSKSIHIFIRELQQLNESEAKQRLLAEVSSILASVIQVSDSLTFDTTEGLL